MRSSGSDPTDRELVAEIGRGSRDAFAALVDRHHAWMCRTARWLVADPDRAQDLTQECFLRLARAAPGWRPRASLRAWLATVARHLAIDAARTAWARREPLLTEPSSGEAGPDEVAVRHERSERLQAVLAELAPEDREALVLSEVGGLSYREIAEIAGVPEGTIASRKNRAARQVRDRWRARWKEDPV